MRRSGPKQREINKSLAVRARIGCGAVSGNDPDPRQGLKRHARLERSVVDWFDIDIRNVAAIDRAPQRKALGFRKLISRHSERRKPSRIVHFNPIIGKTRFQLEHMKFVAGGF